MCLYFRRNAKPRDTASLEKDDRPRPVSVFSITSPKLVSTATTPASSRRNSTTPLSSPSQSARNIQPTICNREMPRRDMYEALDAITAALADMPHAIVGGIALMLLGSPRPTKDVDLVVPDGRAPEAAALLAAGGQFGVETTPAGRMRAWFDASSGRRYNVDVLEPHAIRQVFTLGAPETKLVQGYRVLEPRQLLNFKIASWTDRMCTQSVKKTNHARDITFLVDYLAKKGAVVARGEVYHATDDFLMLFGATYPGSTKLLEKIGLVRTGASRKNSVDSKFRMFDDLW
ncbi:uncharacterized protein DNG_08193 [Cephalotrichum gorgonifer]|uniref:Nucleotidyltransferase family protein n=1 Tax=Cephalotrichum gorgonifer TaxID=2041049 RepID=A0AAE8SY45_9PEZI|nr:uncharacterized protein DNG_08193 [Cephalotrichum gorgonifer]